MGAGALSVSHFRARDPGLRRDKTRHCEFFAERSPVISRIFFALILCTFVYDATT